MAKTLMSHPHIFSSTSRSFCEYLLPSKRLFLCKTRIYGNESFLLSRNYSSRNKLQIHRNSDIASNSSRFGFAGYCRFTTKATHVNDAGSIDSPLMQSMEKKIKESLDAELVSVKDAYGDGRHVSIDVVSSAFEGKSAVNRQRMVYKAIWEELQSTVHAVDQMTTRTPAEAETQK